MPRYTAPTKDMQFILQEVLHAAASDVPGYVKHLKALASLALM